MTKVKFPIWLLIASIVLLLAAGISNGVMDTLQFHYDQSIFPQKDGETFLGKARIFWDPEISYRNKYKNGDSKAGPAFFLSTTALSFLTDAWHLFQFFMLSAFQLAIVLPWIYFLRLKWYWVIPAMIPAKFLFGIGFTLMYSWILIEHTANSIQ